jgi:hypothetical protein
MNLTESNKKKIVLVSAIIGIVAGLLFLKDRNKSSTVAYTPSVPMRNGSGSSVANNNTTGNTVPFLDNLFSLTTKTDNSQDVNIGVGRGASKSGGFSFGFAGLKIGGSSGGSFNNQAVVSNKSQDITETSTVLKGFTESQLNTVLDTIKQLSGTYEQRKDSGTKYVDESGKIIGNALPLVK